jgi:hypothetical protein
MLKLGRNSPCPCRSGRKFKHCCLGKDFTFTAEDQNSYELKMPMTPALKQIERRADAEFRRHFERDPGPGVPLLLIKYLYSEQDLERETVAAMTAAEIDPAIIYAYKKTGYIQSESQMHRYTGAAIAEWDEAIAEFDANGGEPDEGPEAKLFDQTLVSLREQFESLIYAIGLAHDNFFNIPVENVGESLAGVLSATQYQALCVSRVQRTLRTMRILEENKFSEDMLKLARSMYESYLHIVVVQEVPESLETLVDAVVGVRKGSHAYRKRKDGSDDKRVIIEVASGRELPSSISGYKMAESSPMVEDVEFFDLFYTTTSQLIHPSVFALDGYISSHGLDPVKPHMHEEAIVFVSCVAAMVVDWIPRMKDCPDQVAIDCRTVVTRTKRKLLTLLDLLDIWTKRLGANMVDLRIIRARVERLAEA